MKRSFPILLGLLWLAGLPLSVAAQTSSPEPSTATSTIPGTFDNAQLMEMIKAKALVFNVKASISTDQQVIWSADQTRVTVHGLSVSIKLESTDLLILTELTPYRIDTETIMLVVKSELWLRSVRDSAVQYYASLKSASVRLNEPVYFYPLGKAGADGKPAIRMDITVNAYRETKD